MPVIYRDILKEISIFIDSFIDILKNAFIYNFYKKSDFII